MTYPIQGYQEIGSGHDALNTFNTKDLYAMKHILSCAILAFLLSSCSSEESPKEIDHSNNQPPEKIVLLDHSQDAWAPRTITSCLISSPHEVPAYVKLTAQDDDSLKYRCENGKRYSVLRRRFSVRQIHWLHEAEAMVKPDEIFVAQHIYQGNGNPFSGLEKEALVTMRLASDQRWHVSRWLEVTSDFESTQLTESYETYDFPTDWDTLEAEVTAQHADFESLCGPLHTRPHEDFESALFDARPGRCAIPNSSPPEEHTGDDND